MSSVVVVYDVSPVVRTGDVVRIRYRGFGVFGVPKTQHSVLLVCCVGDVDGVAEKSACVIIVGIYRKTIQSYHTPKQKSIRS